MKASEAFFQTFQNVMNETNQKASFGYVKYNAANGVIPVLLYGFGKICKFTVGFLGGVLMGVVAYLTTIVTNYFNAESPQASKEVLNSDQSPLLNNTEPQLSLEALSRNIDALIVKFQDKKTLFKEDKIQEIKKLPKFFGYYLYSKGQENLLVTDAILDYLFRSDEPYNSEKYIQHRITSPKAPIEYEKQVFVALNIETYRQSLEYMTKYIVDLNELKANLKEENLAEIHQKYARIFSILQLCYSSIQGESSEHGLDSPSMQM